GGFRVCGPEQRPQGRSATSRASHLRAVRRSPARHPDASISTSVVPSVAASPILPCAKERSSQMNTRTHSLRRFGAGAIATCIVAGTAVTLGASAAGAADLPETFLSTATTTWSYSDD